MTSLKKTRSTKMKRPGSIASLNKVNQQTSVPNYQLKSIASESEKKSIVASKAPRPPPSIKNSTVKKSTAVKSNFKTIDYPSKTRNKDKLQKEISSGSKSR
jgi:hypothetical protein